MKFPKLKAAVLLHKKFNIIFLHVTTNKILLETYNFSTGATSRHAKPRV